MTQKNEAPNWPKEVKLRDAGVHETEGRRILTTVGMGYEKQVYVLKSEAQAELQAAVAAEREACADLWIDTRVEGGPAIAAVHAMSERIRARTDADARAALESRDKRVRAEAWKQGVKDAADEADSAGDFRAADAIRVMIGEDNTDD